MLAPMDTAISDLGRIEPHISVSLELQTDKNPFVFRLLVEFNNDRRGNLVPGPARWIMRGKTQMTMDERHELRHSRVPLSVVMEDPTW